MQIYRIGREFVRKIVGVLNAVLDASAAVYASTHDSSAPNWEVIPSITLGGYFFCFRFLGRLRFLMFLHLSVTIIYIYIMQVEVYVLIVILLLLQVTINVTKNSA
jgi:hypothetical protein